MQINNSTSPNFKALMIEPTAKEALRKYDMPTLKKVAEAGELLKDTQFYNLRINEKANLCLEVVKDKVKDSFFGVFKPEKFFTRVKGNECFLQFDKSNDDLDYMNSVYVDKFLKVPSQTPYFEMKAWQDLGFDGKCMQFELGIKSIDRAAEVVKELDMASIKNYNEKLAKQNAAKEAEIKAQKEVDNEVDNLLDKFLSNVLD